MMKIQEIVDFLEKKAPLETAEEWDNPGLLVDSGAEDTAVVAVALDATPEAIAFAVENDARPLITHHPVIFQPLSSVDQNHPAALALKNGVSILSLHTNLDKAAGGVNDTLAERLSLLNVTVAPDGMTRVGELPCPMTAAQFARKVADTLKTPVQFTDGRHVQKVAVCGGGAGEVLFSLPADVDAFVTGEMKHHEFLAAREKNLTAVAAGHYGTEVPVVDTLMNWLLKEFHGLTVAAFYGEAPYRTISF